MMPATKLTPLTGARCLLVRLGVAWLQALTGLPEDEAHLLLLQKLLNGEDNHNESERSVFEVFQLFHKIIN